jgi:hypothetical protein
LPTSSSKLPPAASFFIGLGLSSGQGISPLLPPAVVFGTPARAWCLSTQGILVTPDGQELQLLEARVSCWLVRLRIRAAAGGRTRSLLFHPLNTPEPGFRRLRARLRWGSLASGDSRGDGNLPAEAVSQPLTHGASGEPHGGLGFANPHDR